MRLGRLERIWALIRYLVLTRNRTWRWPRRSDVLLFDAAGQEGLMEYLRPWRPEVLHVRNERISMPVLLKALFRRGRRYEAYIDCFIERVKPRLVVTFIQNNGNFYGIAKRHPSLRTLFVQNGLQSYYCDVIETLDKDPLPRSTRRVDYMLTFGEYSADLYSSYIEGSVMPIGSLKNNLFPRRRGKAPGTLVFVSQHRDANGLEGGMTMGSTVIPHEDYFERTDRIILTFLADYCERRDKELWIVPRVADTTLEKEMEYFNRLVGRPCRFAESGRLDSGYDAVDGADVVVCIDSALGFESAARGNRTAFFTIRSNLFGVSGLTFGWPAQLPDDGPFWTNRPDPAQFERILDHLFSIDDQEWCADLSRHEFEKIMAYDPGNEILQGVLRRELGDAPADGARPQSLPQRTL